MNDVIKDLVSNSGPNQEVQNIKIYQNKITLYITITRSSEILIYINFTYYDRAQPKCNHKKFFTYHLVPVLDANLLLSAIMSNS